MSNDSQNRSKSFPQNGFTLIEVIVVLVVAGIILAIAGPSFNTVIKNNSLATQANDLVSALNFARSEAVTRGDRVTVCRSNVAGTACNSGSGSWEDGWLVFYDSRTVGTAGVLDVDPGDEDVLLRVYTGPKGHITLRTGTHIDDYLSFNAQGVAFGDDGGSGNDTFRLCDSRGKDYAYSIVVSTTGRVSSTKTTSTCP